MCSWDVPRGHTGLSRRGDTVFPHFCPLNQNLLRVGTGGGGRAGMHWKARAPRGGPRSRWTGGWRRLPKRLGRLLSVTHAIGAGTCRQGGQWLGALEVRVGGVPPLPFQCILWGGGRCIPASEYPSALAQASCVGMARVALQGPSRGQPRARGVRPGTLE